MKVLHVGNFNTSRYGRTYYDFDRKLSNGFIRNGHYVYDFSYRDIARSISWLKRKKAGAKKMNDKFLQAVHNIRPDLVLLGNAELIEPDYIDRLRELQPNLRIALWYVDPLKGQDKKVAYLRKLAEKVDTLFCTSAGELLNQFKPRMNTLFLPNVVDGSIEILKNHTKEKFDIDLVFIGRDSHDERRRTFLEDLLKSNDDHQLNISYFGASGASPVYGAEFFDTLEKSCMGLSINRVDDVKWYTSDRIAQLTGNGLLTFSSEVEGLRELYNEDEIVYFSDHNDLVEKLKYYKRNTKERQRIAANGYQRAHQYYNSQNIAKYIEEATLGVLSRDYPWID